MVGAGAGFAAGLGSVCGLCADRGHDWRAVFGLNLAVLRRYLGAALVAGGVSALISLVFAALVAVKTALPLGQLCAPPAGVEAMAAMGLALGYDPAFVACIIWCGWRCCSCWCLCSSGGEGLAALTGLPWRAGAGHIPMAQTGRIADGLAF